MKDKRQYVSMLAVALFYVTLSLYVILSRRRRISRKHEESREKRCFATFNMTLYDVKSGNNTTKMEIKVNALMVRAVDYGENDKILTLFSAEHGKISAGIKGVKKAGAKLKFAAQPFCLAEYILAAKGGRYTVINASESESFYDLRCDIEKFYAASSLCEAINCLTVEDDAVPELFTLSVKTLTAMCTGDAAAPLAHFLTGALTLSGYGFLSDTCSMCGCSLKGKDKLRFDFGGGTFTCWECGTGAGVSKATYDCLTNEGEAAPDGALRALRLLREFFAVKTDSRLSALSEYIRILASLSF